MGVFVPFVCWLQMEERLVVRVGSVVDRDGGDSSGG